MVVSHIWVVFSDSPWMMELFLAGTLSGVGCSSPVGLASTGMGPAEMVSVNKDCQQTRIVNKQGLSTNKDCQQELSTRIVNKDCQQGLGNKLWHTAELEISVQSLSVTGRDRISKPPLIQVILERKSAVLCRFWDNLMIRTYLAPFDLPAWPSDSLQSQNTSGLYPASSGGKRTGLHLLDGLQWLKIKKLNDEEMWLLDCNTQLIL